MTSIKRTALIFSLLASGVIALLFFVYFVALMTVYYTLAELLILFVLVSPLLSFIIKRYWHSADDDVILYPLFMTALLALALLVAAVANKNRFNPRLDVQRMIMVRHFVGHMGSYAHIKYSDEYSGKGYLVGKAIVVNSSSEEVDNLYFHLPGRIRASKPDEVGTVILVHCSTENTGEYEGGGAASRKNCDIEIFDKATRVIIGSESFSGATPSSIVAPAGSGNSAERPTEDMVKYLAGLPVRAR